MELRGRDSERKKIGREEFLVSLSLSWMFMDIYKDESLGIKVCKWPPGCHKVENYCSRHSLSLNQSEWKSPDGHTGNAGKTKKGEAFGKGEQNKMKRQPYNPQDLTKLIESWRPLTPRLKCNWHLSLDLHCSVVATALQIILWEFPPSICTQVLHPHHAPGDVGYLWQSLTGMLSFWFGQSVSS